MLVFEVNRLVRPKFPDLDLFFTFKFHRPNFPVEIRKLFVAQG